MWPEAVRIKISIRSILEEDLKTYFFHDKNKEVALFLFVEMQEDYICLWRWSLILFHERVLLSSFSDEEKLASLNGVPQSMFRHWFQPGTRTSMIVQALHTNEWREYHAILEQMRENYDTMIDYFMDRLQNFELQEPAVTKREYRNELQRYILHSRILVFLCVRSLIRHAYVKREQKIYESE